MNLGDLNVRILLEIIDANKNAKKFEGELKNVEVQAKKTATASVSLEDRLQNLGLRFQGVQSVLQILKSTFGEFITSYNEQAIAVSKLSNGLKNVGEGANSLARLQEQASNLMNVTVYDDAEINNAQAMLTTFMKSSDEIELLTPRILDLAAAFDQSGQGGKSLQDVAVMLGKVNEETIGALRRVGVAFTEEQAAKLKSLRGTEQAILLTEILDQNFKGMSQTIGDTAAGKMRQFHNQVGELKEEFGKLLVEYLLPLLGPLKDLIKAISDSPPGVKQAALAVVSLATAFVYLNGNIPLSVKAASLLLAILPALPPGLKEVAVALAALSLTLKVTNGELTSIIPLFRNFATTGISSFTSLGSGIVSSLGPASVAFLAILGIVALVSELIDQIKDAIYWKNKLAGIKENEVKIESTTSPRADATSVPLKTDEQGKLKIMSEEEAKQIGIHPDTQYGPEISNEQREYLQRQKDIEEQNQKAKSTGKELGKVTADNTSYLARLNDELVELEARINRQSPGENYAEGLYKRVKELRAEIEAINAANSGFSEYLNIGQSLGMIAPEERRPIDEVKPDDMLAFRIQLQEKQKERESLEKNEASSKAVFSETLSLASQISSVLGIGAETFAGKLLSGLQQGLSLANSFASLLSLVLKVESGGVFSLLGFASGGSVPGAGSGDTVPAMLTPGEFVVRKSIVQKLGTGFFEWINGGGMLSSMVNKYATGGLVTASGQAPAQVYLINSKVKGNDIELALKRTNKVNSRRLT